ncbi:hypothetical protein BH09MYX1_BH09MYX1_50830 [soil metagenome]
MKFVWVPVALPLTDPAKLVALAETLCGTSLIRSQSTAARDEAPWIEREPSPEDATQTRNHWSAADGSEHHLTLRDDVVLYSERGEPPTPYSTLRARIDAPSFSLYFEGSSHFHAVGPAAADVTARLVAIVREGIRFVWRKHPLVPPSWRERVETPRLVPTFNRYVPGGLHGTQFIPSVHATADHRFALIFDRGDVLPLGPIPRSPAEVLVLEGSREKGGAAVSIGSLFARFFPDASPLIETLRRAARGDPMSFLSRVFLRGLAHQNVTHVAATAAPWIVRYQLGILEGNVPERRATTEEWAIQHDDGGPAIFGQMTGSPNARVDRFDVRVVASAEELATLGPRVKDVLTREGWAVSECFSNEP